MGSEIACQEPLHRYCWITHSRQLWTSFVHSYVVAFYFGHQAGVQNQRRSMATNAGSGNSSSGCGAIQMWILFRNWLQEFALESLTYLHHLLVGLGSTLIKLLINLCLWRPANGLVQMTILLLKKVGSKRLWVVKKNWREGSHRLRLANWTWFWLPSALTSSAGLVHFRCYSPHLYPKPYVLAQYFWRYLTRSRCTSLKISVYSWH